MPAIVIGEIQLGAGGRTAWETSSAAEDAYGTWEEMLDYPALETFETIGEWATAATREGDHGPTFLELGHGDRVRWFCVWADDQLERHLKSAAIALRAAHAGGARGRVDISLLGADVIRLTLADELVLSREKSNALDHDPELLARVLDAADYIAWCSSGLERTRAAYRRDQARLGLPADVSPVERMALDAALALDEDALSAALKSVHARSDSPPAATVLGDVTAARSALGAATFDARVLAIGLWAHADREAASQTAIALTRSPSQAQRIAALRALAGQLGSPALDAMLRCLNLSPREKAEVHRLLEAVPPAQLAEHVLAVIDSPVCDPRSYTDVQPGQRSTPEREEEAQHQIRFGQGAIIAAGARGIRAALPRLIALFEDRHSAALFFRPACIAALLALGGPDVEQRIEALHAASMGWGLALNQDVERRADLLGLQGDSRTGAYVSYQELDVERFERLLDERFMSGDEQQNLAPAVIDFFSFLQSFPEVRAHGYAIGPSRADYRVSVAGLSCALRDVVDPDRRAVIRDAFSELCKEANHLEMTDDYLHSWWT